MPWDRSFPVLLSAGALALLAGCGSLGDTVGRTLPHWAGGLPAGAPERPATLPPYPAVHEMPPPRPQPLATVSEQMQIEAELAALRGQVSAQAESLQKQRAAEEAARKQLEAEAERIRAQAQR